MSCDLVWFLFFSNRNSLPSFLKDSLIIILVNLVSLVLLSVYFMHLKIFQEVVHKVNQTAKRREGPWNTQKR